MKLQLFLVSFIIFTSAIDTGYFWQITDIHSQWFYKTGSDPELGCQAGSGNAGKFGSFHCDTPSVLTDSAFQFMQSKLKNPDFIVWTGDIMPHLKVMKYVKHDEDVLIEATRNFTNLVSKYFRDVPLVPVLGNHDVEPHAHQWAGVDRSSVYKRVLELFRQHIPSSQDTLFLHGGYYEICPHVDWCFLLLNTNPYFTLDKQAGDIEDPLDQFVYLETKLQSYRKAGKRALIATHVPIGVSSAQPFFIDMWPTHHNRLMNILKKNADLIIGYLAGHEHTDSFRVMRNENGHSFPVFAAPAILVEAHDVAKVGHLGNNPGVRLFKYDRATGDLLDYEQYWMNLTLSNEKGVALWNLEYRASSFFGIENLNGDSMMEAYHKLVDCPELFHEYWTYQHVLKPKPKISDDARRIHLCGIKYIDLLDVYLCHLGRKDL
ncbi:hypothetical protein P9112_012478 [Eukaryota sp. TZLM1-RC]